MNSLKSARFLGYLALVSTIPLAACGGSSTNFDVVPVADGSTDTTVEGDTAGGTDSGSVDGPTDSGKPGDGTPPTDTGGPIDTGPTCADPKKLCGAVCVDTSTDMANCGACATPCAAPGTCIDGKCAKPKCKSTAPTVLFYGNCGSMEKPYLPTGATSTIADDTKWRGMKTADFAKFDLIVIGAPDTSLSTNSMPTAAMLLAAFETRTEWSAAVNGRIVVLGLDPSWHAGKGTAGAVTFQKAALQWLATGPTGSTALYVNSDWAVRKLDFLGPFGAFSSSPGSSDKITITKTTDPIMTGSTDSSLSGWGASGHSLITFPAGFVGVADGTTNSGTVGTVAITRDAAACAGP